MAELTADEIVGVAYAGMRGSAFISMLDDVASLAGGARQAFEKLDEALESANTADRSGADSLLPEDEAVVEAAKVYARSENEYLGRLLEFLVGATEFDYSILLGAEESDDSGLRGLLPNV